MKAPAVNYQQIINALQGSRIRLQKYLNNETLKIIVPAYRLIKRLTLSHVLKQAQIPLEKFIGLL